MLVASCDCCVIGGLLTGQKFQLCDQMKTLSVTDWSGFRAVCCQTICVLYLQIAVLGTDLHWINIQLISGYTLILQQWLIHTGLLSGGKLLMSRAPAEALGTDQDAGPTWWCFVHKWPRFSLFFIISYFFAEQLIIWHGTYWNNISVEQVPVLVFCICM